MVVCPKPGGTPFFRLSWNRSRWRSCYSDYFLVLGLCGEGLRSGDFVSFFYFSFFVAAVEHLLTLRFPRSNGLYWRTSSIEANPVNRPNRTFLDDAVAIVQDGISDEHRETFRQYEDVPRLLESLKAHGDQHERQNRQLQAYREGLVLFTNRFAPYLALLKTCVKTQLDLAGWLWGIIGLVFHVGTNILQGIENDWLMCCRETDWK